MRQAFPPFLHEALVKLRFRHKCRYEPSWHTMKGGILKGSLIFIDTKAGRWQQEMINGAYDAFLFDYLTALHLRGKTVFDIGAHIGYHAMTFASLIGSRGTVYAFEPNRFNVERLRINVSGNRELSERIRIYETAVSDRIGTAQFYFSRCVDNGTSSGSFISEAHTYYEKNADYLNSFETTDVETYPLDQIGDLIGPGVRPDIIKIDVEGAEGIVLEGAKNVLIEHKPLLLIEVHSIYNMVKICEILGSAQYNITFLKEEPDGRCFLAGSCTR
jgi:FkbM family methyltransferase